MSAQATYELAIVGGGIAGAAAALRAGQYNIPTAWVLGDQETARASRSKWVRNVDNMIGVHPEIVLRKLREAWADRPDLLRALDQVGHLHITTQDMVDNVHQRLADHPGIVMSVPGAAGAVLAEGDGPAEQRHVRIDSRGETSIPGLFAIGDLARRADEPVMMQIYTAQEYAVRAVDTIDRRRRERMRRAILESATA